MIIEKENFDERIPNLQCLCYRSCSSVCVDVETCAPDLVATDWGNNRYQADGQQIFQELCVDDRRISNESQIKFNVLSSIIHDHFVNGLRLDKLPVQAAQSNGPSDAWLGRYHSRDILIDGATEDHLCNFQCFLVSYT